MNAQEALEWYDEAVDHVTDYLGLDREEQQAAWNALQSAIDQLAEPKPEEVEDAIYVMGEFAWANPDAKRHFDLAVQALRQMKPQEPCGCDGCVHQGKWENEIEYGAQCPCLPCSRRCADNYLARKSRSLKGE